MKLFVSEGNPHCLKVLAALEVTGVQCGVQYVNHEGRKAWFMDYNINCSSELLNEHYMRFSQV